MNTQTQTYCHYHIIINYQNIMNTQTQTCHQKTKNIINHKFGTKYHEYTNSSSLLSITNVVQNIKNKETQTCHQTTNTSLSLFITNKVQNAINT